MCVRDSSKFRAAVVSPKLQDAPSFGSDDLGVIAMGVFHFSQSEDPAVNPVNGTQTLFSYDRDRHASPGLQEPPVARQRAIWDGGL